MVNKHAKELRFVFVGGLNTAIDFVVFFTLVYLGLHTIISNFFSTSAAMSFSFFANKSYTFKDNSKNNRKQIAMFLIITVIGLWVIQPIIIETAKFIAKPSGISIDVMIIIGKVLASGTTMVWNYFLYQKFVFKKQL